METESRIVIRDADEALTRALEVNQRMEHRLGEIEAQAMAASSTIRPSHGVRRVPGGCGGRCQDMGRRVECGKRVDDRKVGTL